MAERIRKTDRVLDLGCGILHPFGGQRLDCAEHVGVDCFKPYLDKIGPPTIAGEVPGVLLRFGPKTYDVVLLLDIIEHLTKAAGFIALRCAETIAAREVIVFTPDGYIPQTGWEAWGMEHNPAQAHLSGFTFDELTKLGYTCSRHPNGSVQHGPMVSVLGIKCHHVGV